MFDKNEIEFLLMLVNERIINSDKQGISKNDSSSIFRKTLVHKLLKAKQDAEIKPYDVGQGMGGNERFL